MIGIGSAFEKEINNFHKTSLTGRVKRSRGLVIALRFVPALIFFGVVENHQVGLFDEFSCTKSFLNLFHIHRSEEKRSFLLVSFVVLCQNHIFVSLFSLKTNSDDESEEDEDD